MYLISWDWSPQLTLSQSHILAYPSSPALPCAPPSLLLGASPNKSLLEEFPFQALLLEPYLRQVCYRSTVDTLTPNS